jgi:hypothetical protein
VPRWRDRPRRRHRDHHLPAPAVRRPPGAAPAEDRPQRARRRAGPHHRRGAARPRSSPGGRARYARQELSRQRIRVHLSQRRSDGPGPAVTDLTGDTYTSVLPVVAHKAAEDVATLIIQAGCLVPGTTRPRQPEPPGHGGGGQGSGSRAHPGRQVSRPARADLDINRNRLSGNVPAQRRNAHMLLQMGSGHPAIPRPTSAHTDTLTREKIGVKPRVSTGAPPGTRTPNPRIKSGTCHSVRLRVAAGGGYRVLPGRTGTSERTWSEPNIHADRSRPSWPRVPGPWRVKV